MRLFRTYLLHNGTRVSGSQKIIRAENAQSAAEIVAGKKLRQTGSEHEVRVEVHSVEPAQGPLFFYLL
ncbi:hypothetical protein K1718_13160 [Roseibium porphyridii]|uniref:Uncharacterized protein n=1 Tax=Roseibium porphyridii TaxID=2866279 RepID=A0ABY8FI78_9HYPH|nr:MULTISPECIES: hypothetical protein [Stappiaceae]QFT31694.1 hypothetical protein FIV00_14455 [Labrenzia sp. THAF82]WFE92268.1 hypothetical protein K1718_13160 [Roseibium sp. KMA01]